jgi:hypothetical protein
MKHIKIILLALCPLIIVMGLIVVSTTVQSHPTNAYERNDCKKEIKKLEQKMKNPNQNEIKRIGRAGKICLIYGHHYKRDNGAPQQRCIVCKR